MTVWVLNMPMTAEEENRITERAHLPLPFEGLPDLSLIHSAVELKHLLQALSPDAPPETITRRADHIWQRLSALAPEDIIAVPLPARREIAIAEIAGRYEYRVGEKGDDVHGVRVTWHQKRLRQSAKTAPLFAAQGLAEITDAQLRVAIRDRLPHSYNRFAPLKWLLVLFFLMQMVVYAMRLLHRAS